MFDHDYTPPHTTKAQVHGDQQNDTETTRHEARHFSRKSTNLWDSKMAQRYERDFRKIWLRELGFLGQHYHI